MGAVKAMATGAVGPIPASRSSSSASPEPGRGSPSPPPSNARQCSICREVKAPEEFIRDARRASGLDARCKMCRRQQHHNRKMQHLAAGGAPTVAEKECTRCHVVKPAADFKRHSYTNSGLDSWCKACCSERRREKGRGERVEEPTVAAKECSVCRQTKAAQEFTRDTGKRTGLGTRCKVCEAEYRRQQRRKYKQQAADAAAAAEAAAAAAAGGPPAMAAVPATPATTHTSATKPSATCVAVPMVGVPTDGVQRAAVLLPEPAPAVPAPTPQRATRQSAQHLQQALAAAPQQPHHVRFHAPATIKQEAGVTIKEEPGLQQAGGSSSVSFGRAAASSASGAGSSMVATPASVMPAAAVSSAPAFMGVSPRGLGPAMSSGLTWLMGPAAAGGAALPVAAAAAPAAPSVPSAPGPVPMMLDDGLGSFEGLEGFDDMSFEGMGMDPAWRMGSLLLPFETTPTPTLTPTPMAAAAAAAANPFAPALASEQQQHLKRRMSMDEMLDEQPPSKRTSTGSTCSSGHRGWVVSTDGAGHTETTYQVPDAAPGAAPSTVTYIPAPALHHAYPALRPTQPAPVQQTIYGRPAQQPASSGKQQPGIGGSVFSAGPAALAAAAVAAAPPVPVLGAPAPALAGVFSDLPLLDGIGSLGELPSWGALEDGSLDMKLFSTF
eukprot:CAMPEP_0202865366 /NCGR_PEP_ID=MMETSP1391-20130828/5810_1 /ASSEMBLY_ACC=CAM_ASM_000867 /TAXON_ID=1034604 /ORGANISM="Chlamydomonas leiostraca, Strain SAG 11-49" /LENGTH=664 /DNA_ID=CAMNT_0049545203 /DNA_START=311 /DNA_END=2305 /DNA_ORIENTATION=+